MLNASDSGGASIVAQRLSDELNQSDVVSSKHLIFDGEKKENNQIWANTFIKKKWAFFLHALEKLFFLFHEKNKSIRFAFSDGRTGIDITQNPLFKEADLIHLHWINKGFISLNGLNKIANSGKTIVWTCHDMWAFTGGCYHNRDCENYLNNCGNCQYLKKPSEHDLSFKVKQRKAEIYKLSRINFVTPSAWLMHVGIESGIAQSSIRAIGNALNTQVFKPLNQQELKTKYGLQADKKYVLFISGNLKNKYKGFLEFKNVIELFRNKYGNEFEILVVGDKWETTDAEAFKFLGYIRDQSKLAEIYNMAEVYITTSLEENLPTTVMEAAACGTPVLAFNVGGTKEILFDEILGTAIDNFDLTEMVEQLHILILTNEDLRKKRHELIASKFSMQIIAQEHINLYQNLVNNKQ